MDSPIPDFAVNEDMSMTSLFHQQLLASFADIADRLHQIMAGTHDESISPDEPTASGGGVWEIMESFNVSLENLRDFISSVESQTAYMDTELRCLQETQKKLQHERDMLMEKGHELNCRLGYNALERKLEESFSELQQYKSEESARCFRDEAEENLKRTQDLLRLANIRSCELDKDIFKEMGQITNLFENYERDRELYIKELDLFTDIMKHQISNWLTESRTPEQQEKGENLLDYLSLAQRERHMEPQVIKNALRMYSFNASLNFDREDNLKRMAELSDVQDQVNRRSSSPIILLRDAEAKTNLLNEVVDPEDPQGQGDGCDTPIEMKTGKTIHRCRPALNLAFDAAAEPDLLERPESPLGLDETEGSSTTGVMTDLEQMAPNVASTSSSTVMEVKGGDSVCGDADSLLAQIEVPVPSSTTATEGFSLNKTASERTQTIREPAHSYSLLRHIESSRELNSLADGQLNGLVRKKPSGGRAVGSLTSMYDAGSSGRPLSLDAIVTDARDTRSQGCEPVSRVTNGGNRSRELVPPSD